MRFSEGTNDEGVENTDGKVAGNKRVERNFYLTEGSALVPVPTRSKVSAAAGVLRLWVPIPRRAWMFVCHECCVLSGLCMDAWMFVCHECCVLSGRGLCYELITSPEES